MKHGLVYRRMVEIEVMMSVTTPAVAACSQALSVDIMIECLHFVLTYRVVQVEIEKPLGLKFKASKAAGGGCVVSVRSHQVPRKQSFYFQNSILHFLPTFNIVRMF